MKPIKIIVNGASGRMGQEVINALCREPDMQIVGAVELQVAEDSLTLPNGSTVPFSSNLENIIAICQPHVLVDFTTAQAVLPAMRTAAEKGVNLVTGTTGLTADELSEIDRLAATSKIGAVVAPNFALSAVIMIHLAKIAAKYFDYAEITELHHHMKIDAPSGTALSTAKAMAQAKGEPFHQPSAQEKPSDSRGKLVEGINIHSIRLPGLMAHQEVLLGTAGQTLSIRHDTIGRECYMPGVILAVREVVKRRGLIFGLDTLLDL